MTHDELVTWLKNDKQEEPEALADALEAALAAVGDEFPMTEAWQDITAEARQGTGGKMTTLDDALETLNAEGYKEIVQVFDVVYDLQEQVRLYKNLLAEYVGSHRRWSRAQYVEWLDRSRKALGRETTATTAS